MLQEVKKRKEKAAKCYGLESFLQPGCPISVSGPFRDNVRLFLEECGQVEDYSVEGMPIWCTLLVHENRGFTLPLYTIEECVNNSLQPLCDHCKYSGWSHNFVSKKKYHFIIPIDYEWSKPIEEGVLDLQTHILHGLIHSNGFGHLLCINGIEGGSNLICGREVMDLWDRICTSLHSRKISVVDISKKRKMDLRLLYGISYGYTWFGRWDYKFCHGSFGVTKDQYEQALQILSSLRLDFISQDDHTIETMITRYRELSDDELITIRDMFRFMLSLKYRTPQNKTNVDSVSKTRPKSKKKKEKYVGCRKFPSLANRLESRWQVKRLEHVANVVVNILKEKKTGMSRQDLRENARLHVGDTGLIDYVLKSMDNVIVGEYVVRRALNPCTGFLEYSLQDEKSTDRFDSVILSDVYADVEYLYQHVLIDTDSDEVKFGVSTVLDSKNFTKEWPFTDYVDDILRFVCRLEEPLVTTESRRNSVIEFVEVPFYATIGDLKAAVETAMRDTYCVMEKFEVRGFVESDGLDDNELIFGTLESGSEITASGFGVDLLTANNLQYEGGADNWVLKCICGARDDDGERMVACDICDVWQHTRCSGIDDDEAVPPVFMCYRCCDPVAQEKYPAKEIVGKGLMDLMMVPVCKDAQIDMFCY
uniref:PHD finger protein MALE MEIOCYTE DEATH 1 n=1 Tax=Erigeron canadensis TaxID=72917 RepID=UPI001CB8CA8D|nr:PHD finger protein MALE MEIOCYTE DEATH 1 [Erigeron canadensis]